VFDWLFEGNWVAFTILTGAALVLTWAWWRTRRKNYLIGLAAIVILIGLYELCHLLVETPREQIKRKLDDMAAAVQAYDTQRIFQHISDQFQFQGYNKAEFRQQVQRVFNQRWLESLKVWDQEWEPGNNSNTYQGHFRAKPRGPFNAEEFYLVRATFIKDPDGQWRLQEFRVYNPVVNTNDPMQIPPFR
jgi:ketosteroid isomerase-like protein